ncbi:hypothetical protein GCM10010341_91280 [Streptomyces noursei]|nr:hypothetical protein GCM10010341_91280 [Streptomyces noursei]
MPAPRSCPHQPRKVTIAAGVIEVKAPQVNDKRVDEATGERKRFSSADPAALVPQVPENCRGAASALPARPVLGRLRPGNGAVPRLLGRAVTGHGDPADRPAAGRSRRPQGRDLFGTDYIYVWVDGIHLRIRLNEAKATVLVVIGVRADGTKELVAMTDGYRESSESWAALLRDCARRGMHAPVLAVGDGALGFWKALREVYPDTREQRCWVHKTANVLDAMPKSAQPAAKKAIQDICNAEDRDHAERAIKTFARLYGAKFPKAVKKIIDDQDVLLAFFGYPAEHWIHLRTTNPIESTFAPSAFARRSPRAPDPAPPGSPWCSSSSSPLRPAGAPSTVPTSSLWSAPEPASSTGGSDRHSLPVPRPALRGDQRTHYRRRPPPRSRRATHRARRGSPGG